MIVRWIYDDGGRKRAGFRGEAPGDCVTRAIAIVTERPYRDVYREVNTMATTVERHVRSRKTALAVATGRGSSARLGVLKPTTHALMALNLMEWVPTMGIGTGCRVHLRAEELPAGRIICAVSKHVVAVIDGIVYDTHDSTRNGTRCVYGYWRFPPPSTETGGG